MRAPPPIRLHSCVAWEVISREWAGGGRLGSKARAGCRDTRPPDAGHERHRGVASAPRGRSQHANVLYSGVANLEAQTLAGVNRPDAVIVKGSALPALVETIQDLTRQSADDQHYLEVRAIPLQQAVNAFDSWLGLNARIRESDRSEPERREVLGLDSLTRIFFELRLQMLEAAQHRVSEVSLRMWVRRGSAELALRALENIRGGGFDHFYESWGYVAVPEAAEALRELSEHLNEALVTTVDGKAP